MTSLNIVGGGRLGKSVARLAHDSGRYRIGALLCRSQASVRAARDFVGAGVALTTLADLPAADITLLAVPDGEIAGVAADLAAAGVIAAGSVVCHASGVGEAALLAPLAAQGVHCASLHPAFSFADPARAVAGFSGTRCALEGDAAALPLLQSLAADIGGVPFVLAPGGKAAYHAALSIASNYLVTLHDLAARVAAQAGMADEVAAAVLGGLMRQTLDNTLALGPAAALTGPIARGDAGTVVKHRAVLSTQDDALYCALGVATARLAAARLTAAQQQALAAALGAWWVSDNGGAMTENSLQAVVLAALQHELRRQGESDDYPGSSAAVGALERAALCGVFDLEELAAAVCQVLRSHGGKAD